MPTVTITPIDDAETEVWRLAREVSGLLRGLPWVLIGGLMVRIIEAEHGVTTEWTTGDVDTVLDVRAVSTATEEASRRLMAANFVPEREEDLVFRFVRGNDIVDVLATDNLGGRAKLTTVPPNSTMQAIGSRQAISRSRVLTIDTGDSQFNVPVPSLVGAIVIKGRVVGNIQNPKTRVKHERDLARLLALAENPVAMRSELSRSERGYLRQRADMMSDAHRAWARVPNAEDGAIALSILINGK
ncbi:MAG: hypothetical protein WEG56_08215 [Chloroflexota bacterium]